MRRRILVLITAAITVGGMASIREGSSLYHEKKPPIIKERAPSMAQYFPKLPLLYLQVKDASRLISSFERSKLYEDYLKSRNYKDFCKSRLYKKLKGRFKELGRLLGFSMKLRNIATFLGKETGLWLYDIGELKIVLATKIPKKKLLSSKLYDMKRHFETRRTKGHTYFVKEREDGGLSFAFTQIKDTLLISNDLELFGLFLHKFLKEPDFLKLSLRGFRACFEPGFHPQDITLYLHQSALNNRYFKTYWIFKNYPKLTWIKDAVLDVRFGEGRIVERRIFNLKEPIRKRPHQLSFAIPEGCDWFSIKAEENPDIIAKIMEQEFRFKIKKKELCRLLRSAQPKGVSIFLRSGFKENFLFYLEKGMSIELAKPLEFSLDGLKDLINEALSRRLIALEDSRFQFKKLSSDGIYYLDLPFIGTIFVGLVGDTLFVSNSKEMSYELMGEKRRFDGSEFIYTDLAKARATYLRLINLLAHRPNWRDPTNPVYFRENIGGLVKLTSPVGKVLIRREEERTRIKELVRYEYTKDFVSSHCSFSTKP